MKALAIESWALRVLERVGNRQSVEDSKVELKAKWPDPVKAARRIAGHANAARGESILWLIGADEKQGVITGANYQGSVKEIVISSGRIGQVVQPDSRAGVRRSLEIGSAYARGGIAGGWRRARRKSS